MDNVSKRLLQASAALALTAAVTTSAEAQSTRKDLQTGNKLFNQENYRASIPYYERVIAKDPNNAQALFRAGVSYLSFDKEKASDYIYKAQKLKPKVSKDVEYWLGRVDHLNYNFDEAITHYQAYNATLKKRNDTRREEVAQLIQHSRNAKILFNSPKDIFVKNLGPTVNTQYAEHSPVISSDDKTLIYTTRANPADIPGLQNRAGKKDIAADGEYYEGIVETHRIDADNWEKPRSLAAALNSKGHDASDQLFDNDTKLLMYRDDENGDVFVASKQSGGDWGQPVKLNSNINSKQREGDAYITPDGLTLYFSTARYTEDGNIDLYYSTRTAGGDWGPAKSLGSTINTKEDDDSPYISRDGTTLYFSSKGHNTMGGYDIFASKYDSIGHKWGRPENMGYPINTPDDDSYYRLAPDGTYAYLSSYRIGGYGEKDIYTISYIKNINIKGAVFSKRDSTQRIPGVELVFNGTQADKTAISFRDITKEDGSYQVKVLSARTYQVAVNKDGKNIETQEFAVPISTNDSTSITKNFYVDYIDTAQTAYARMMKPIYFDTDKYKLRPESIKTLNATTAFLKANTGLNISIEGNCDSRNTDEYNMVLGQNRADAAKNYLVKQGISASRLTTVSYGERKPKVANDSPENMQINRRDDFKPVLKEGETMPTMVEPTTTTTTTTVIAVPVKPAPPMPGKTKVKMADGTKVKTKVDEDSDKVKVKTKGAAGEKSKTISKDGELDSKAKDASGEKAKVKTKVD
jgi:outer membrane protein OmpA-like peptidoglycan-associated protein/tetratricopeptide (TPR) repeat protein